MCADVQRDTELASQLAVLMDGYLSGRKELFKTAQAPRHDARDPSPLRAIPTRLWSARPLESKRRSEWETGRWCHAVAVFDTRDTTSTKKGVYVILLFRADMSGVYVTLNQGASHNRWSSWGEPLHEQRYDQRTVAIRARFPELLTLGSRHRHSSRTSCSSRLRDGLRRLNDRASVVLARGSGGSGGAYERHEGMRSVSTIAVSSHRSPFRAIRTSWIRTKF